MMLSPTVLLGNTVKRRCRLATPDADTTVCGRPVTELGTVTTTDPRAMNCPDCWQAMSFITGH